MNKERSLALRSPNFNQRDLVDIIFRRKWLILITLLTAGIAAAVFAWITPDMYESKMKILVRNTRVDAPLTAGAENAPDRTEVSPEQISSEMELIKSRDLLEKVVEKNKLAKPEIPGELITKKDFERAVNKLESDLNISPVKKANMIEVSYPSKSAEKSAAVLETLSGLYLEKHIKLHSPPGAYDFFKEQADHYENDLRTSQNQLSTFQQRQDLVEIDRQKEMTLSRLLESRSKSKDLSGSIRETDKRITELENQLSGMKDRIKTQNRVLPNQFSTERLNTMLIELQNKRIQLLAKFRPEDRMVKEVDEQIKITKTAMEQAKNSTSSEESFDINPVRQNFEQELAKAKIDQSGRIALQKNISEQVKQYESELAKFEQATPTHEKLVRTVKEKEEAYQLYAKKQEESRINDALDKQKISNVSIAEEPGVPQLPNSGSRLAAVIMGLGLGLVICVGSVFISELMRDSFLTPTELEEFTDYPILATIPLQTDKERQRYFDEKAFTGELNIKSLPAENPYRDEDYS